MITLNMTAFLAFKISSSRVKNENRLSLLSWSLVPGNRSQYHSEVEIQIWTDRAEKCCAIVLKIKECYAIFLPERGI